MSLAVPNRGEPVVSVLMAAHGGWPLTRQAIAAIIEHTEPAFELIVVDNASPDETGRRLGEIAGLRLMRNRENRGFGPANHPAAAQARGEFLFFLNTDAFVHPGWLEPLLATGGKDQVGAVVPRLLNADGSLQEAGGLLARDGSVLPYGDGDDPDLNCYRFPRAVDYGSAAGMLMRRSTFAALGGFDERYAPAYFEDLDLCLRMAEQGLGVRYEPASVLTHVRGGSGKPDAATALSERNHRRFVERWHRALGGRPWTLVNASGQAVIAARDALASPRVLIGSPAGHPAAAAVVEELLAGWPRARVTWANESQTKDDPAALRARGAEVLNAEDGAWLEARLFHYDLVLVAEGPENGFASAVARTQPQAPRLSLDELWPSEARSAPRHDAARQGTGPAYHHQSCNGRWRFAPPLTPRRRPPRRR